MAKVAETATRARVNVVVVMREIYIPGNLFAVVVD